MAICTLSISMDSSLLRIQLQQLSDLLEHLPKRRVRRFSRKVYRLFFGADICQIQNKRDGVAAAANGLAFHVRVVGLDELIAAAMRASKRNFCHGRPFQ